MSADFDQFPLYDPIIKAGSNQFSDVWVSALATFLQTLISYLGSYGIVMPSITTAQRNSIQSPQNGQMIYNTDLVPTPAPQIYQNGAWKTFTTT